MGLLRSLRLAVVKRWPFPAKARLASGGTMFVDLRSPIGRGIYRKGVFDPAVFSPIGAALKDGGVFLDVGANIGYYTMCAIDQCGAAVTVHCFEIDPRPLKCLRKTIATRQLKNVHLHEIAAGELDGQASLIAREDDGHSSVTTGSQSGPTIPMTRLDSWHKTQGQPKVTAIKFDIEGGELAALRGAAELVAQCQPTIICEVIAESQGRRLSDPEAIFELLSSWGYHWEWVPGTNDPTIVAKPSAES